MESFLLCVKRGEAFSRVRRIARLILWSRLKPLFPLLFQVELCQTAKFPPLVEPLRRRQRTHFRRYTAKLQS